MRSKRAADLAWSIAAFRGNFPGKALVHTDILNLLYSHSSDPIGELTKDLIKEFETLHGHIYLILVEKLDKKKIRDSTKEFGEYLLIRWKIMDDKDFEKEEEKKKTRLRKVRAIEDELLKKG